MGKSTIVTGWVIYVTNAESEAPGFADAVTRVNRGLKPLSVAPHRLISAMRSIRPRAIVLDSRLKRDLPGVMLAVARHASGAAILTDRDLSHLERVLR
jgi:hypothetical protein